LGAGYRSHPQSWLLSRMMPLYFSSAPVPSGLNPHVILCATSCMGFTDVHVSTPNLATGFSAWAVDIKATTDTQMNMTYRMATFLLAA
jgi:hypothetical protein